MTDSLALLHPFMPFITEEIWEKLTERPGTLIVAAFPEPTPAWIDERAERTIETFRALVTRVRNFRGERAASPTEPVELWVDRVSPQPQLVGEIEALAPLLTHLARLSQLTFSAPPASAARDVVSGLAVGLAISERGAKADAGKLTRTLVGLDDEIEQLAGKLRNTSFLDKAPPAVVEKTRRRLVELEERRAALSTGRA